MNRKGLISRVLIIILVMTFMYTMTGSASSTTKNLSTNYTVVNMSPDAAVVTAEYYKPDGTVWVADPNNTNFTVDGNFGQKVIRQYDDNTMSTGKGSAVLSSDQPLGAVVQIQARNQVSTNGAYTGYLSGSEQFYVPLVIRNAMTNNGLANTQMTIQNLNSAAMNVTVEFIASPGTIYSNWTKPPINIPAYSSNYYDIQEELPANLPDGWVGSAKVSSNDAGKQIAVVVNIFTGPNGLQTSNAFPAERAYTSWAVPQFASRLLNGFSTTLNIQNISGSQIAIGDIDVHCIPGVGFTGNIDITNAVAIPNNASFPVNPMTDMSIPALWNGSCIVTATGNIVVFSNLRTFGKENIAAYETFPTNLSDTKVIIPLMAKRLLNGFATAGIIQNLDPVNAATVRLTYTRSAATNVGDPTYVIENVVIPAGGSLIQNLRLPEQPVGTTMPDGWYGTLLVEAQPATTARPIVGYVQLTNIYDLAGDTMMAHDAFTLP